MFHVSLLKPFVSNGEAVDPVSFTIRGGKPLEFEVEKIYDFEPKTKTRKGGARKVKDLTYYVKWRGVREGIDAEQPWKNIKGTTAGALRDMAARWGLPEEQFDNPNNLMAAWTVPNERLPPPPPRE